MKKSSIWLLTSVLIFAFLGLLYLQLTYVQSIWQTQEVQFKAAVRRSLFEVSHDLELDETRQFLSDKFNVYKQPYSFNRMQHILPSRIPPSFGKNNLDSLSSSIRETFQSRYSYQQNLLDEVIRSAMRGYNRPIQARVGLDSGMIETYIRQELAKNDISVPFVFTILNSQKQTVYASPDYKTEGLTVYSQVLFPNDPANRLYILQVALPMQKEYMVHSIVRFVVPSVVFTVVLLIVFTITIFIIFRQRRLSEMKNDFINNMTHELKTPVASISLAAQTLSDTDLAQSPTIVDHAQKVIIDESKRLGFLVEKVLQMSLFDDKAITFKMTKLDVNDLIVSVAGTFALRVENVGGTLDVDLEAMDSTIVADKMHFTNVIFNLLENALKYRRPDVPPLLMVRTRNVGNKVQIRVEDNGIGIKKESLKKIFDRFYRVSTGNRHDVKGFGLGLAYVKRIIDDFDGTIKAESELGEGTTFIITLPYVEN